MSFLPSKIVSGGQTGVDRAALDFAARHDIPYRGFVPKGRSAEDGRISNEYTGLVETASTDPAERTRLNVESADALLVISRGEPDGGTNLTLGLARQFGKPTVHVDLAQENLFQDELFERCFNLVRRNETMIAGPRESKSPGIYSAALDFLERLFVA